jgi:hypothetical protein
MPVQDFIGTYTGRTGQGYAGMIAEAQTVRDVASKTVTTSAVAFGLAVGAGATDGSVRLGGTGYIGITVADKTRAADQYAVGEVAGVMRKGTIWVNVPVAVADTDTVYFIPATGVITNVSTDNVAIPGAKFEITTTGAGLTRLYLG